MMIFYFRRPYVTKNSHPVTTWPKSPYGGENVILISHVDPLTILSGLADDACSRFNSMSIITQSILTAP